MIRLLPVAALLLLAACATSHTPPKQFDLGEFDSSTRGAGVLAINLIIPELAQPSWLRTRDIFYRRIFESPDRPQRYAQSRWVATPGELMTLRLREAVQAANSGFILPASRGVAGYLLQASIDEFTQVFATSSDSRCVLVLRATLWRTDGPIVAQREFRLESAAPTPDAAGAVHCLTTAADRAGDEVVQWLREAVIRAP